MPWVEPKADLWLIPNEDPTRHYRWISMKPSRLSAWLRSFGDVPGYRLECGKDLAATEALCERLGLPGSMIDKNLNRIVVGDCCLASIPREEFERRERIRLADVQERLDSSEEEALARANELPGVKMYKEHPAVSADKKEFHTRSDRPFSGQTGVGDSPQFRRSAAR